MAKQAVTRNKIKSSPKAATKAVEKASSKAKPIMAKEPGKKAEEKKAAGVPAKVKVKLVTSKWIAGLLNVSLRRVQQLTQDGTIEKYPGSVDYEFEQTMIRLVKFAWKKMDSRRSSDSEGMAVEKLRQLTAKRELDELKLAREKGDLHHTEDIKRIIGSMFTRLNTGFDSFDLGLAPLLVNEPDVMEIAAKIKSQKDRILYEVANFDFETFCKTDGSEYVEALGKAEEQNLEPVD